MRAPAVLLTLCLGCAQVAPELPVLLGHVSDHAAVLPEDVRTRVGAQLRGHEDRTGNQIVVATVRSLGEEDVEGYAVRLFQAWRLGQAGRDNGVLVLVAVEDREMRIEVGYGLEGVLTDALAGRIIREHMTPHFRGGDYSGGLQAGVAALLAVLEQGNLPAPVAPEETLGDRIVSGLLLLALLLGFSALCVVTPGAFAWIFGLGLAFAWLAVVAVIGETEAGFLTAGVLMFGHLILFATFKLHARRRPWYGRLEFLSQSAAPGSAGAAGGGAETTLEVHNDNGADGRWSGGGGSSGGGGASGRW